MVNQIQTTNNLQMKDPVKGENLQLQYPKYLASNSIFTA